MAYPPSTRTSDLETEARGLDAPGFTDSLAEARDKLVEAASAAGNALRAAAGGAVAVISLRKAGRCCARPRTSCANDR